jgi:hypothetical protein
LIPNLAAPQGFEPRYADPESAVLPLNEGAECVDSLAVYHISLSPSERCVVQVVVFSESVFEVFLWSIGVVNWRVRYFKTRIGLIIA